MSWPGTPACPVSGQRKPVHEVLSTFLVGCVLLDAWRSAADVFSNSRGTAHTSSVLFKRDRHCSHTIRTAERRDAGIRLLTGTLIPMGKRKKDDATAAKIAARRAARKAAAETPGPRRAFEGLRAEADWVAMRELVPAATANVTLTEEYGGEEVVICTLLPQMWPALKRADGVTVAALQMVTNSGDASRDVAAAILLARGLSDGTALESLPLPGPGPRLQDIIDTSADFEVSLYKDFGYSLDPDEEQTEEVKAALDEVAGQIVPTYRLGEGIYWCRMNGKEFVRWVRTEDEDALLDAFARLQAAGEAALAEGYRNVGSFRSSGLLVPVWELPAGTEATEVVDLIEPFEAKLQEALKQDEPLSADERRARAGWVSRQVTLR